MHSYEDRIRAVELYYRYGKKASVVVMELGYPSTKQLGRWVRIYEEKGDLPRELKPRERYSRTQKIAAVEHYLTHGGCLSYTRRAIGYPSNEILKRWIEEFYPNARPLVIRSGTNKCFSPEERSQAVRELCNRRGTARKVAQSIGVSVPVLYKWKKDLNLTKDKEQCVKYAEQLFNKSFRTQRNAMLDGPAEASLIGHWFIQSDHNNDTEVTN